jgi:chromosome segregation ATPase
VSTSSLLNLPENELQDRNQSVSADEFQALEEKVLRAVEIVRREREARAAAEAEVVALRQQLDSLTGASNEAQTQITALNQERDVVRTRVEKLLGQLDELL